MRFVRFSNLHVVHLEAARPHGRSDLRRSRIGRYCIGVIEYRSLISMAEEAGCRHRRHGVTRCLVYSFEFDVWSIQVVRSELGP